MVGKRAPDFTLEDLNGEKISLRSYRGKNVVLFFSEGVMCYPACWRQILGFGVDPRFRSDALAVVTILVDAKDEWKKATRVVPELASTITVFDSDHAVSKAYGVLDLPSSMHKGESPGHSYIIVDKNGIVRFVHDDVAMGMRNAELLEEIQKLNG
ncbi:MAG: redoxin domain-containing protein [Thermoleophilia bacterium]|nr:redoxin domain-containing protein [Thermoleophilia bacterium]